MVSYESILVHKETTMKSITVHGMDKQLDQKIREKADEQGTSLNKTIKGLLQKALGIIPQKKDHEDEFMDLFGIWSDDKARKFTSNIKEFESVDIEDWK